MRGSMLAAVAVVVAGLAAMAANAQQPPQGAPAKPEGADPDQVNAPERLRGRSIVIDYVETRVSRIEGKGPPTTRRLPFQLVVYISTENRAFNRLTPGRGRAGSSDQVKGARDAKGSTNSRDMTGFATRDVAFDGLKMTVANEFGAPARGGGTGKREISATFDENFTKCTAEVVLTIRGDFVRRRLMKGGFEELISAKNDNFACTVQDGNALITES